MARRQIQETSDTLRSPAPAGSVSDGVAVAIKAFMEMEEVRALLLADAFGAEVKQSAYRNALIRKIMDEFTDGRVNSIRQYQNWLLSYGSATKCRNELLFLADRGLVLLEHDGSRIRLQLVVPTVKLARVVNGYVPQLLRAFIQRLPREVVIEALSEV